MNMLRKVWAKIARPWPLWVWALIAVGMFAAFVAAGCRSPFLMDPGPHADAIKDRLAPRASGQSGDFRIVGWLAGLSLIVGVATLILSRWIPLIPVRASVMAILAAVGLWVLQALLVMFLKVAVIVVAIGAGLTLAVIGIPWVIAYVRRGDAMLGHRLIQEGDVRAGVALVSRAKRIPKEVRRVMVIRNGGEVSPPKT